MSNDNKTLADVQPGGRVRLGDQAERARFEAWCASQRFPLGTSRMPTDSNEYRSLKTREAWRVWQAALSAQPSPGGQGDAQTIAKLRAMMDHSFGGPGFVVYGTAQSIAEVERRLAPGIAARQPGGQDALDCIGRIEEAIEFRVPHDIYAAVHGELAELKAALAARQPVGEPVALGETDPIPCAWSDDDASSLVTLRDALRRIIAGTTTKDAAHFLKQPGQRRMTIKDAQEVAAAHLPYVESLVHRSQGYAAPPAQAVDLGQFRPAVECWRWTKAVAVNSGELDTEMKRSALFEVNEADRLLALIDSQAVGK
ncbi:hypothetical protein I5V28_16190 [Stenotrophomonas maltophilia]|uniref:hypothetical protein n=1 Tax=Stenotrophomonas maltophilia group sp. Smal32 TaxID=3377164 RepID=UPI0018D33B3E|nr:hypothetical protein [Stenotrophomonas maltophilia]MBH1747357.1 hypothetical protein [Stenotrophomonas maltophilia]